MSGSNGNGSAVVVGGGLAGLAAAAELGSAGFAVTIVEKNMHLGGKMNVLRQEGFRFDMGPTILTLPDVFRGIVKRSGRRLDRYADGLVELPLQWRCMYEDGKVVDLYKGEERAAAEFDRVLGPGTGDQYRSFMGFARRMHKLSERVFYFRDLGSALDMMKSQPLVDPKLMGDVMAMRMHSTVAGTIDKHVSEPHLKQLCEHFLQYVGSSPFLAPAILSLIAAAQSEQGVWYARGGTRYIADTLERIVREQGATVLTGRAVKRIIDDGGHASGVELEDGTRLDADLVVSNCDTQRTNRDLVGGELGRREQEAIAEKYTPACSGVVLYLGLNKRYDHLEHHNFLFSKNSHDEFGDIYDRGVPARDPTLYIAAPAKTDPSVAPPGGEALYILVHTAYVRPGQRWEGPGGLMGQYRPVIIEKLKRFGMKDIESRIVVDRAVSPQWIGDMYNCEGGAIYGLASHGRLHGGFKPRNRSRVLRGLYLCGGSANPGPGVPMVLMSGVTAAWSACQDARVPLPAGASPTRPMPDAHPAPEPVAAGVD